MKPMENKKLNKMLKYLYLKWIIDWENAEYYGSAHDARVDFTKLFKILNYKLRPKHEKKN